MVPRGFEMGDLWLQDPLGNLFPFMEIAEAHVSAGGVEEYYEGPSAGNSVIEDEDFNRLLEECG